MLALIHLEQKGKVTPSAFRRAASVVALARALAIHPQVLLLDEPLSALDATICAAGAEIRAIQKKLGITAIYVTHDQEEALSISDRIVVMYDGKIEQVGSPFEIYNFPTTAFVAGFLGTLNTTTAEVVDPVTHLLQIDGVQFQAAEGLDDKRKGDTVTIAIRPDDLILLRRKEKPISWIVRLRISPFLGPSSGSRSRSAVTASIWIPLTIHFSSCLKLAIKIKSPVRGRPSWFSDNDLICRLSEFRTINIRT